MPAVCRAAPWGLKNALREPTQVSGFLSTMTRMPPSASEIAMSESDGHIRPADYTWKDIARIALGVGMVVLGIAGLILPILNGTLFLIISAFLLAPYSRRVRRLLDSAERRFPTLFARARSFGRRWFTLGHYG